MFTGFLDGDCDCTMTVSPKLPHDPPDKHLFTIRAGAGNDVLWVTADGRLHLSDLAMEGIVAAVQENLLLRSSVVATDFWPPEPTPNQKKWLIEEDKKANATRQNTWHCRSCGCATDYKDGADEQYLDRLCDECWCNKLQPQEVQASTVRFEGYGLLPVDPPQFKVLWGDENEALFRDFQEASEHAIAVAGRLYNLKENALMCPDWSEREAEELQCPAPPADNPFYRE